LLNPYVINEQRRAGLIFRRAAQSLPIGAWITFPGNLMDGQLVHWKVEPYWSSPIPLPREFWRE
jgi:hypothetical protein